VLEVTGATDRGNAAIFQVTENAGWSDLQPRALVTAGGHKKGLATAAADDFTYPVETKNGA
jgi:hypothetical protein